VAEAPAAVPDRDRYDAPATANAKPEGESMFAWLDN
jgi:hypothetical protein